MKNKKTKKQISEKSKENKQKSESELEKEIEETESQEANEVLEKTSESQEASEVLEKTSESQEASEVLEKTSESQEASEVLEKTSEETIDDNEFREFVQPSTESFSPVLERVEIPQQESLEQDVASTPTSTEKKDEEQIKYSPKYNETDYKIIEEESRRINENLLASSTPITIETTGINLHPEIEQNFQIAPELQELRRTQGKLEEDYVAKAEKLDTRDNRPPFESTQRKYKGRTI